MKQFNLEEYLANPSRKVVTKSGLNARIICTDRKDLNHPIVALIENQLTEGEGVLCYTKEGKVFTEGLNDLDLFFAPEKHEGWINLYRGNLDSICAGNVYTSKDGAEKHIDDGEHYLTTIKIEWEE